MHASDQNALLDTVATREALFRLEVTLLLWTPAFAIATLTIGWLQWRIGVPENLLGRILLMGVLAAGVVSAGVLAIGWRLLAQLKRDAAAREAAMSISLGLPGLPVPGTPVPGTGRPPAAENAPS